MIRVRKAAPFVLAALAIVAAAGMGLMIHKDQTWSESPAYARTSTEPARVLVVAYSRSGHSLAAAKEAAHYYDADLVQIEAPAYPPTFGGQRKASDDADAEVTTTEIRYPSFSVEHYDLVVLASPTWWFRPAVPLWSFVEETDFAGRPVFLLLTGNSRYEVEQVERFAERVADKNGHLVDHHFIERGRVYWQKSDDEVRAEVRSALREQASTLPD